MLVYLKPSKFLHFLAMNRLQACLFLRMIPGLGNVSAKKLWEFSPSPQAIFDLSTEDFHKLEGIGTNLIGHLKNWKNFANTVYQEEENLQKNQIKTLFLGDHDYPKTLAFLLMPPWFCFTREISTFPSAS